jgi:hypothetical protein
MKTILMILLLTITLSCNKDKEENLVPPNHTYKTLDITRCDSTKTVRQFVFPNNYTSVYENNVLTFYSNGKWFIEYYNVCYWSVY